MNDKFPRKLAILFVSVDRSKYDSILQRDIVDFCLATLTSFYRLVLLILQPLAF